MAGNFGSEIFEDRRVESIMRTSLVKEKGVSLTGILRITH